MRRQRRGRRPGSVRTVAVAAALVLLPAAAGAQRLWSVGEVSSVAEGPDVVMEGVRVGLDGLPGMPGVAQPAMSAKIEVTFDYLRLGMGYLELPLPDGSIGVAGTSEVEKPFHETVPVAASSGEAPWRAEQYPRRASPGGP